MTLYIIYYLVSSIGRKNKKEFLFWKDSAENVENKCHCFKACTNVLNANGNLKKESLKASFWGLVNKMKDVLYVCKAVGEELEIITGITKDDVEALRGLLTREIDSNNGDWFFYTEDLLELLDNMEAYWNGSN